MCNHNPNDSSTSLLIDSKKWLGVLQSPRQYKGICKKCGQIFTFIKVDGEFIKFN